MGEKWRVLRVVLCVIVSLPFWLVTRGALLALVAYALFHPNDSADAEARRVLTLWSAGLARCGERDGGLPPTSSPVPATLRSITGKQYQVKPSEWGEPAHLCSGVTLNAPQGHQYSWLRQSPQGGVLTAVPADARGRAGAALEVAITCRAGRCSSTAAALADAAAAREREVKRATSNFVANFISGGGASPHALTRALAWLASLVGFIWLLAAGFSVHLGWGIAVALLPCVGGLAFGLGRWEQARQPFLCWSLGSAVAIVMGVFYPAPAASPAAAEAPNDTASTPETHAPSAPPPVPSAAPLPPLDGAPVDLSTLMGRARKLANAWQPEAALLGIEATLVDGKVQPQAGGTATLTFGPSPFAQAPGSGLFAVSYDKLGITSGPAKGLAGKALAEPMCAPEGLLPRLTDPAGTAYGFRYALAPDQRPAWLVSSPAQPKLVRVFDPQTCGERGSILPRSKR